MKKYTFSRKNLLKAISVLLVVLSITILFTGCTDNDNPPPQPITVDVDLTVLSSTMVYAEVSNIMTNPTSYIGKTIKVSGTYSANYYEPTNKYYSYVVIADATACCAQGIEFELVEHDYPDDYPTMNAQITIIGIFQSYEELGHTYYYIAAEKLT